MSLPFIWGERISFSLLEKQFLLLTLNYKVLLIYTILLIEIFIGVVVVDVVLVANIVFAKLV